MSMKASAPVLFALLFVACTAKNPAYEKEFAQLNENIVILQSERDRLEERIAVLEAEREHALRDRPRAPTALERPRLKVVQLAPPDDQPAQNAAESAPPAAAERQAVEANPGERVLIQGSGADIQQLKAEP